MSLTTTAHLNFRGDARPALEFYQSVFGGQLTVVTYQDMGAVQDPAEADQVMWGEVATPDGFHVMAFDMPSARGYDAGESPFFLSVRGTSTEEITGHWEALADGADILTPLAPAPWGPLYGMLKDRFGVTWIIDIAAEQPAA